MGKELIDSAIIFELDDDIVIETIKLRKLNNIKLPDAIIAASAILYNLTILTRNTKDFNKVAALKILHPHDFQ